MTEIISHMAASIEAALGDTYQVTITDRDFIDIRVNPAAALHGFKNGLAVGHDGKPLDFLRVVDLDEGHFELYHMNYNACLRGTASFNGSMAVFLPSAVKEICETIF